MATPHSLWQALLTQLTPHWSHCVLTKLSILNICILCWRLPVAQEPQLGIPTVSGAASMKNEDMEGKCLTPSTTPWWGQLRQVPCNPPLVPQGSSYHSNLPFSIFPSSSFLVLPEVISQINSLPIPLFLTWSLLKEHQP